MQPSFDAKYSCISNYTVHDSHNAFYEESLLMCFFVTAKNMQALSSINASKLTEALILFISNFTEPNLQHVIFDHSLIFCIAIHDTQSLHDMFLSGTGLPHPDSSHSQAES